MTISVDLPPDLEARFVAEAKAKGVSVGEIVKTYLYNTPPMQSSRPLSVDELDKSLDAAADLIPEGIPPLSDYAMRRESIYTREDDWNQ